jgi:hypothetical protein
VSDTVAKKGDNTPKRDPLADEIDALLKKLPHAESESPAPRAPSARPAAPPSVRSPVAGAPASRKPAPPAGRPPLGVWAQVAAGVVLGGALTQWPYAATCGWGLLGYAAAVVALLIVGGWCAMESWRSRLGAAHIVSLAIVFWGVALAAEVVLPRIGYAAEAATWRCVPAATAQPPQTQRPAPITPSLDTVLPADATADSTLPDSAAPPIDSITPVAETSPEPRQD